jgi:hypothetical protein
VGNNPVKSQLEIANEKTLDKIDHHLGKAQDAADELPQNWQASHGDKFWDGIIDLKTMARDLTE